MTIAGDVVDASGDVFQNYEVQRGDHLDELARAFATTRDVLLDANHIRSPYTIHPGQIMKVPVAKAYVARSGDTLAGVARRFCGRRRRAGAAQPHLGPRAAARRPGDRPAVVDARPRPAAPRREYAERPRRRLSHASRDAAARLRAVVDGQRAGPTVSRRPVRRRGPAYGYRAAAAPRGRRSRADAVRRRDRRRRRAAGSSGRCAATSLAGFGPLGVGRRNDGIDIRAAQGTAVKAAAAGEVVYAGNQVPGFGNLVLIKHADGWVTAYAPPRQASTCR